MSKSFNLQLFGLEIEGIDQDILKELGGVEEETEQEEVVEEQNQEETPVEADNVEQTVEQPIDDDDEEYQASGKVPYQRFKAVNDERKLSKSRIKELEEELATLKKARPVETPAQPVQQVEVQSDFTKEQFQRIDNIARERVMKKLNLTKEDIDDMEYADDSQKAWFNHALVAEHQTIMAEIKAHQAKEAMYAEEINATAKEFSEYNAKFGAYPDAQARWEYISKERFNQLPARKQTVINAAFARLQANKGTYQDLDTVSAYFDLANAEWDSKNNPVPNNNNATKVKQVQALPKAPSVNGGSGADTVYTVERIASIMNSPNGWESLPAEIQKQILEGRLK